MTNNLTNNYNKILPNISRSKGNRKITFGQLVKYKMKNIFLEKSFTKCCVKLLPDPFLKNQNWGYF